MSVICYEPKKRPPTQAAQVRQMSKLQILLLQILGCIVLGIVLGTAFRWFDGGKTSEKVSDCHGGGHGAQIRPIEIYAGRWHKDYLEVIGK